MQKEYINLKLDPYKGGKYMLVVFHLVPKKGEDLLACASEVAAESSTGSNLRVGTATKFSDDLNAIVYKVNKKKNLVWIAFPWKIFDRGGNVQNILTYVVGNVFGMSNLKALRALDCWFPSQMLKNYDGPSTTIMDAKKYLGIKDRPILGTIVKPKIGLKPKEFAEVCFQFWSGGGDFVKFDEPQADQEFCPFKEVVVEIRKAMNKAEKKTGKKKLMSFNISAADFMTMKERGDFIRKKMKKGSYIFLVDGITAGWSAVQTARRLWPDVFIHFHRAGHGCMTREENPIGYTVPFMTKFGRLAGASGMHTGTAGIGKMAGTKGEDINAAHQALFKKSKGDFFEQDWGRIKGMCPIVSGGLNPVLLKPYADAVGTTDFITTMGGGVHSHPGGTASGAAALLQACEAWQKKIGLKKYAKDHEELAQAIEFYVKKIPYTKKYLV
ncbi:MAG: ribulose-bisphosphate carboxylase [Patescibacteria group bacterium]|nr:ribulose-bisphosphate carboxylase [Patescibacteria group bacterium]